MNVFFGRPCRHFLFFVLVVSSVSYGEAQSLDQISKPDDFPLKITISNIVVSDDKTNVRVIGELQNIERHLFLLSCKSAAAIVYQHFDTEDMPDGKTYEVKGGTATDFRFPLDCGKNREYKDLLPGEVIKFDQILKLVDNPNRPFFSSEANFELHLLYTGGGPSSKQKLRYWKGNLTSNSVFFRLADKKTAW